MNHNLLITLSFFSAFALTTVINGGCAPARVEEPIASTSLPLISDLLDGAACNAVITCSCGGGVCSAVCASSWCLDVEADTACKTCIVDSASGCGLRFGLCMNPPSEPAPCGGLRLCDGSEAFGDCEALGLESTLCAQPVSCDVMAYCGG